jgi:UDP-glucose:(heptosyl)LPS alpha-1,3-glucosyltransferase
MMIETAHAPVNDPANVRRKPHVALVAHEVHQGGGQERACWELVRRASAEVDFTVISIVLSEDLRPLVHWRRVHALRRPAPLSYALFFGLAGMEIRRLRPDIVHTVGAIVPNRIGLATVQFSHAGYRQRTGRLAARGSSPIRRLNTSISRLVGIAGEAWCYRPGQTSLFAPVSPGIQVELQELYPGIPYRVTPNGVDLGRFRPDPDVWSDLREKEGVPADGVVALFVGGDWHRKGLDIAIHGLAVAQTQTDRPLLLWVVGRGDERQFRALATECGVGDRVRFFGFQHGEQRFYQAADIVVVPTLYETFSLAAYQGAACGLPVVGTRVSGIEDLIGGGEAGLMADRTPASVGAAISRLAEDEALRIRLGNTGRQRASRFGWDSSVASVLECYRVLLDGTNHAMAP